MSVEKWPHNMPGKMFSVDILMTEGIPAEPSLLKFQPAFGHGRAGLCNTERLPAVPVPPFFLILR